MDYSKEMRELFLIQQIFGTLFSVTNKIQTVGDGRLRPLSVRQLMIMISIIHLPEEETTLKNIAKMMETSKQNTNKLVSGLKSKGYLEIRPSKTDKREINISITNTGKQLALECTEKSLALFAEVFKDFSEGELELLWKLLKKLYCFDGEIHDKFEEEAVLDAEENTKEWQEKAFMSFVALRNKNRNPEND